MLVKKTQQPSGRGANVMGFHQGLRHDLPHRLELTTLGVLNENGEG